VIPFRQWVGHPAVEWAAVVVALLVVVGAGAVLWPAPLAGPDAARAVPLLGPGVVAVALAGRRRRTALLAVAAGWLLALLGLWTVGVAAAVAVGYAGLRFDRFLPRTAGRLVVGRRWGRPVVLSAADRLLHCQVIGPTGSGKSLTALLPWMIQDLFAGIGFTLIEPKGDLADRVRAAALPFPGSLYRLDPLRPGCPHWNPLAGDPAAQAEGLVLALEQLDPAGHPFYRTVGRVLLVQAVQAIASAEARDAVLEDVVRFFRDAAYRADIVARADPEPAAYFRQEWARLSRDRQQELALGIVHRVDALLLHPALRRLFRPPFDLRLDSVIAPNPGPVRILASFPESELGSGARALAILLWHALVQAAYRAGPTDRLRHALYLDEFQLYVTPNLAEVLALIRGYGVAVVVSHQDMGQLSPTLQAAVATNVRSRLLLGGGRAGERTRWQEEAAAPLPNLRYLPRGRAVFLGMRNGRPAAPLVVRLPRPPVA
jgi:hypothetical protein